MLRFRRPDDLPGCVPVLAEVRRQDGYPTRWPEQPAAWLSPPGLLAAWVATADDAVCGHVALVADVEDPVLVAAAGRPAVELAAVSRLFVRPTARGAMLGRRLLETAMAFAAARDLRLVLDVVDEQRSAAISLYERLGWRYVGIRPADWLTPAGVRAQLRLYVSPDADLR